MGSADGLARPAARGGHPRSLEVTAERRVHPGAVEQGWPPVEVELTADGLENVPKPATLLLLGSGLTGLALRRRRQG